MKLLLTSSGLRNRAITRALEELLERPCSAVKLAFIPTAANVEIGEKHWLISDLVRFVEAGFEVDIVDISALDQKDWLTRLQEAQVLVFGGGNTFHLMHSISASGLGSHISELLTSRIYVGISAGSCVTGPSIYNSVQNLFHETYKLKTKDGLNLVPFQVIPHLNSPHFPDIQPEKVSVASKNVVEPVYLLDDNSALMVIDTQVTVVTEGEWFGFNGAEKS